MNEDSEHREIADNIGWTNQLVIVLNPNEYNINEDDDNLSVEDYD